MCWVYGTITRPDGKVVLAEIYDFGDDDPNEILVGKKWSEPHLEFENRTDTTNTLIQMLYDLIHEENHYTVDKDDNIID